MGKLDIKDIAIGDWLTYSGHPYMVYSVDESGVVNARNGDGTAPQYVEGDVSQFEPRPITIEVLLDNGFTEIDLQAFGRSTTTRRLEHGQLGIVVNAEGVFSVFDMRDIGCIDVLYLHELQRAARALGLEDELTL